MVLADLSQPRDDGSFPWRVVSMARTEAQVTGRPASAGAAGHPTGAGVAQPEAHVAGVSPGSRLPIGDRVLLFATTWCPHCREAEQYLKARGVAFQRLDVEAEPGARDLLLRLFKEGGIPAQYANSVPILYVKGQVLMGFDRAELEKLL
jgi:glutaredoxin